jgi:hypothetical protein
MYGKSINHAASQQSQPTAIVEVFMAGDIGHAKQVARRFCMDFPCCVTITSTTFVYRGGEEEGLVVAFRNYPRFPVSSESLLSKARSLADLLRDALSQRSYMIVEHGGVTTWSTIDE